MLIRGILAAALLSVFAVAGVLAPATGDSDPPGVLTGEAAFVSSNTIKPGVFRKITAADMPKPYATESAATRSRILPRPDNAWPQAPTGFKVDLYATGLRQPRIIAVAPNGDVFVMETQAGQVRVFRGLTADGKAKENSIYTTGLHHAYGMAFYPPGNNPQWLYLANTDSVVRHAYKTGDMKATGPSETVIDTLPSSRPRDITAVRAYDDAVAAGKLPPDHGHWTRDIAFSLDGKKLFVAVGSASNVDDPDTHPSEHHRAAILEYTPQGKFVKVYAWGIRNPSGIAVNPATGQLWCSVNERDGLGDNLVPDYITHVQEDGFYGWPWYYIGSNPDPRHAGKRPDLRDKVLIPDVLLQSHTASLQMTFYTGKQFPAEYHGDIFASQHGSWNRRVRSGYEVVRVPVKNGKATGVYQDFLTGFVTPEGDVWGRPVGAAVAHDGALLVSDDGSHSIWRVTHK